MTGRLEIAGGMGERQREAQDDLVRPTLRVLPGGDGDRRAREVTHAATVARSHPSTGLYPLRVREAELEVIHAASGLWDEALRSGRSLTPTEVRLFDAVASLDHMTAENNDDGEPESP